MPGVLAALFEDAGHGDGLGGLDEDAAVALAPRGRGAVLSLLRRVPRVAVAGEVGRPALVGAVQAGQVGGPSLGHAKGCVLHVGGCVLGQSRFSYGQ